MICGVFCRPKVNFYRHAKHGARDIPRIISAITNNYILYPLKYFRRLNHFFFSKYCYVWWFWIKTRCSSEYWVFLFLELANCRIEISMCLCWNCAAKRVQTFNKFRIFVWPHMHLFIYVCILTFNIDSVALEFFRYIKKITWRLNI